jgi:hypothetical protein
LRFARATRTPVVDLSINVIVDAIAAPITWRLSRGSVETTIGRSEVLRPIQRAAGKSEQKHHRERNGDRWMHPQEYLRWLVSGVLVFSRSARSKLT